MGSKFKLQSSIHDDFIVNFNNKCTGCNKCRCLMMTELDICMKDFTSDILINGFSKKQAFSCVDCLQCNKKCDLNINKVFNSLKVDLSNQFESNIIFNTPFILQKKIKTKHEVSIPKSDVVFMPGCSLRRKYPHLVDKTMKILQSFDSSISLYNGCCTKPVKLLGKENLHLEYLEQYEKKFLNTTIITACFSCDNILSDRVKTVTIYEYMLANKLVNNIYSDEIFSVKLPCHLNDDKVSVCIDFLKQLGLKRQNQSSICCGSGGLIGHTNYKLSKKYLDASVKSLRSHNVVCFCAECNSKIQKHKNSKHVLEIILESDL